MLCVSLSAVVPVFVDACDACVSQDSELPFQFGAEDEYEVLMRFESP